MNTLVKLKKLLGNTIRENFNLTPYLTLRTNTEAQYYFEADIREKLIKAKKASIKLSLPIFILGGGSNLAVTAEKIYGLVVHNRYIEKKILERNKNYVLLKVSSGYPVTLLANETAKQGFEGVQYHLGLPGTVGGALYMNSKWTHPVSYFGDSLEYACLIDNYGKVKKVNRDYFGFAYDTSILQKTHETVLDAVFKLKISDPAILTQKAKDSMKYRKKTQPFGVASSGCFFRNVDGRSAGQLIDKAGLKGTSMGNFYVSDKHANFIINKGHGDPHDLVKLIHLVKEKVKSKFGVQLKEEVIVI